jgi:hypothetical protein
MKKSNKNYFTFIILGLVLLGILYFTGIVQFTIFAEPDIDVNVNFLNSQQNITSTYFGSLNGGHYTIPNGRGGTYNRDICGGGDGSSSLSNQYSVSENELVLSTQIGSNKESCGQENYMYSDLKLPKGNYLVTCDLRISRSQNDVSYSGCDISINDVKVFEKKIQTPLNDKLYSEEQKDNYYFNLTKDEIVKIKSYSYVSNRASSSSRLSILYSPIVEQVAITPVNPSVINNNPTTNTPIVEPIIIESKSSLAFKIIAAIIFCLLILIIYAIYDRIK